MKEKKMNSKNEEGRKKFKDARDIPLIKEPGDAMTSKINYEQVEVHPKSFKFSYGWITVPKLNSNSDKIIWNHELWKYLKSGESPTNKLFPNVQLDSMLDTQKELWLKQMLKGRPQIVGDHVRTFYFSKSPPRWPLMNETSLNDNWFQQINFSSEVLSQNKKVSSPSFERFTNRHTKAN